MTQKQVNARLRYWQKVLRLQDWTLFAEITRAFDLDEDCGAGQNNVLLAHKTAKILLRDPSDYTGRQWVPIDVERILVHELLHCHFEGLWPKERKTSCNVPEEQVINALTDALIELERKRG